MEPTIKHLVVALGDILRHRSVPNQHVPNSGTGPPTEPSEQALLQYGKALTKAQKLLCNDKSIESVLNALIACALFISFDLQTASYVSALKHLTSGINLVESTSYDTFCTTEFRIVVGFMRRLQMLALTFQDSSALYPVLEEPPFKKLEQLREQMPESFTNILDARDMLVELYVVAQRLCPRVYLSQLKHHPLHLQMSDWLPCKCMLQALYHQWWSSFSTVYIREDSSNYSGAGSSGTQSQSGSVDTEFAHLREHTPDVKMLIIYHKVLVLLIECGMCLDTMHSENFFSDFAEVLFLVRGIVNASNISDAGPKITVELGVIIPLFNIAFRCRDPKIRGEAIDLLKSIDVYEGPWGSIGTAAVCDRMWRDETARAIAANPELIITKASDIPSFARVITNRNRVMEHKRGVDLTTVFYDPSPDETFSYMSGIVTF